jgi:hypothetical protein
MVPRITKYIIFYKNSVKEHQWMKVVCPAGWYGLLGMANEGSQNGDLS